MARQASLRQKGKYWATDANGKTKRFGKVAEVPYAEALRAFRLYLGTPEVAVAGAGPVSVAELADRFLAWVSLHRGRKAHAERSRHIARFRAVVGGRPAGEVGTALMEDFVEALRALNFAPDYIEKHLVSVKAMYHKGIKKGWIPPTVDPFGGLDPIRREPKALTEEKLPTADEVRRLIEAAEGSDRDAIRLYHATGARTGELMAARAADYQRASRSIVLARHKRSHTLRQPTPRTITLNEDACGILDRITAGLEPAALLFSMPRSGKQHSDYSMAERFRRIRCRAGVRSSITIYSLRHLWISDALAAGVDLLLVAKMAGTGVKMVETVYGHWRAQSFQEAQARIDAARMARP